MFIGKWNRSVILTYIGLTASIIGMYLACCVTNGIKYAFACFIIAGVCDMFDGWVARKCKRTEEEKKFGIQLDSLVDVVSFVVFPIVISLNMGLNQWYHILIDCFYAIAGIARLGYFNILAEDAEGPIKYYTGLPVTLSVLIFAIFNVTSLWLPTKLFESFYTLLTLIVAVLFISKIRIKKAKGFVYILFSLIAVIFLILYLFVL